MTPQSEKFDIPNIVDSNLTDEEKNGYCYKILDASNYICIFKLFIWQWKIEEEISIYFTVRICITLI